MKYLGIDYGTKRVGLAVSDENGKMAFPYKTLANDNGLVSGIYEICQTEGVGAFVIGESLDFNGNPNELMSHINKFISELELKTNLQIHMQKEFMTTVNARQQPGGGSAVDASAAALILQRYLDKINTTQITN